MSRRIFISASMVGAVFMVAAGTVTAAEMNLKAGYFISNKKSLTRQAFDQFAAKVNADGKGLVRIGQI
ncbi:MAG: hypothetical protein HQ514_07540, partial [Rhodospirillales bacterium]|nr:hypothetical protein [Rhodospirillales bacterium]